MTRQHDILDTTTQADDIETRLKKERKTLLMRIGGLIVINTILFPVLHPNTFTENLLTALNANLIGFNILGFIIGTVIGLFPYKGVSDYNKRWLRASLWTIFVLQSIMFIGLMFTGILALLGYYPPPNA